MFRSLTVLTVVTSTVNVPNMLNMVTYLYGTMHMGISSSSTTVTNVLGATSGFALLGAFLSDSYITRARTILLFGPLEFLVIRFLVYSTIYIKPNMIKGNYFCLILRCQLLCANLPIIKKLAFFSGNLLLGLFNHLTNYWQSYMQGYGLLALQAYLPSLRPPPCNAEAEASSCREVHGRNAVLLYAALYISAFGDGFMRACMPPLGADQFDHEDPSESRQQSSFFNWYTFGISFGGFIGLILIVWLENSKGWDVGFGVCAFLILLGLLVVAAGLPLYRNHVPEGSPLTRILQVLVVAFKNRKLQLPEKLEEAQEERSTEQGGSTEVTEIASQTNSSLKQRRGLVSLQHEERGGDKGRAPRAPRLHQLPDRLHVEPAPLHLHRAAGRLDQHPAGEDPRLAGDALHHPQRVPDGAAPGVRPLPRAAPAAAHGLRQRRHPPAARRRRVRRRDPGVGHRRRRGEEAAGRRRGGGADVAVLAGATVLPARRLRRDVVPGPPRALQQRGAPWHEVHRVGAVLVRARPLVVARHAAGAGGEQGHEAARRRRRRRVARGRHPQHQPPRPLLLGRRRRRAAWLRQLPLLGEQVHIPARPTRRRRRRAIGGSRFTLKNTAPVVLVKPCQRISQVLRRCDFAYSAIISQTSVTSTHFFLKIFVQKKL
ncbi:Os04g0491200 [Oryza sativa Japonica Group]|uniref:Os04g0491200 protein n=1 Tax=Oryza sativa subsp. japonica TaxID=39947 RepID=A0A0P0WBS7_ORYSJ|nr:hypothetical protein EE612_024126 [Oryza sativa]BAS89847.1 Os04g0491200 [Oryza sativa Japonica Group]